MEYQKLQKITKVIANTTYFRYSYILIAILCYNSIYSRLMAQLVQVYFKFLKYFCPISVYATVPNWVGILEMFLAHYKDPQFSKGLAS